MQYTDLAARISKVQASFCLNKVHGKKLESDQPNDIEWQLNLHRRIIPACNTRLLEAHSRAHVTSASSVHNMEHWKLDKT